MLDLTMLDLTCAATGAPTLLTPLLTPLLAPPLLLPPPPCAEVHFSETGRIMKLTVDCVSYSGPQLLARYAQQRQVLVPGLAGSGSFDE